MPPHRPRLDSVYGSLHDDIAPLLVRQSGAYTVDEVTPRFPKAARVAVVALVALTGVMAVVASAPAASVAMVHAGIRIRTRSRGTGTRHRRTRSRASLARPGVLGGEGTTGPWRGDSCVASAFACAGLGRVHRGAP